MVLGGEGLGVKSVPIELDAANEYVRQNHRHLDPVYRDKWRLGCVDDSGKLIGVIQAARPIARHLDDGKTIDIVRCCTDGMEKNSCSFLLGRAYRIAAAMGYTKMISYILEMESGVSYKAAGWHKEVDTRGHSWNCPSRPRKTTAPTCNKQRWAKIIKKEVKF